MNKQDLLGYITDYYLNSGDFNGTPNYNMPPFEMADLVELIEENRVSILSNNDDINMYILVCVSMAA